MSHWNEFDHVIINDELGKAVAELEAVLQGRGEATSTSNRALQRKVARIVQGD